MKDNSMPHNQTAYSNDSVAQREAFITGKPPRIEALAGDEVVALAQKKTAKLRMAVDGESTPVAVSEIPEMLLALMCHPDLYESISGVSIQLMAQGTLSHRERELVILRVGWLWQAPYEWGEHVRIAKMVGISRDEIEAITQGSSAACWNEHEAALMKAAEELHAGAMVGDATWEVLARAFDDKQLFELLVLIGQFTLVAYFQNSLRFRLSEGNEGLNAR